MSLDVFLIKEEVEAVKLYIFIALYLKKYLGESLSYQKEKYTTIEELFEKFPEIKDVFVDGIECKVQRPVSKK